MQCVTDCLVKNITHGLDTFFEWLGLGAHKNPCVFQGFVCILNLLLSIHPLICHVSVLQSIHVVFWLGKGPMYINLATPALFFLLNIGVFIFQAAAGQGSCWASDKKKKTNVPERAGLKAAHTQMGCFLLFLVLGSILIGFGSYVLKVSEDTAQELIHSCGSTPMTMRLEQEWGKLEHFFSVCARHMRRVPEYVQQCPYYGRTFPDRVFANYLEDLEADFNCVGFCKFWAKPLFNPDADRGVRCATALGDHLVEAGMFVGVPPIIVGCIFVILGICLRGYDNL